ncbi:MAG: DPP IV N-terminal domain-containing protein [Bacteroidales bacterium]|nr:DPP IV N-terminal domain-containing protein [Bacteroidales bacterium]
MMNIFKRLSITSVAIIIYSFSIGQDLKQLSSVLSWKDNSSILMTRVENEKRIYQEFNINTGSIVEVDKPIEVAKASVLIKEGDIFYTGMDGIERRVTYTELEEKNPELSPNGEYVAFTRNSDLYTIGIDGTNEVRYTNDGSELILNGWASWVYYEEILGRASRYKAFWWSPDSRTIAFMRFDDSNVPMFPIYEPSGKHGKVVRTRYPKAGDSNPLVRIGFADIASGSVLWGDFNELDDQYFGTPYWNSNSDELLVQWMDREQSNFMLYSVFRNSGEKRVVYKEHQDTWIDWLEEVRFGKNGFYFVRDFELWEQIYYQSYDGKDFVKLTDNKNWGVRFLNFDEENRTLYFTARRETSVKNDFYLLSWNKGVKKSEIKRLSVSDWNYSSVVLSPDMKNFVANVSTLSDPTATIIVSLGKGGVGKRGDYIFVQDAADGVNLESLPKAEMLYITTHDGYRLPASVIWPEKMDKTKKHPVIVSMYGGPNSGTVMNSWRNPSEDTKFWYKKGVIQISIDHRASGHCGKEGLNFIHRNLGKQEIADYILWAKFLNTLPFVDSQKIGITGFSYGGTMTLLALTEGADYFRFGVAGGGVYDWHLYDTHYTERYMDTPQKNPVGYKTTSVLGLVSKYRSELGSRLFITHGTSDDNVHFQNTLQLIDALQKAGKQFDLMIYPGGMHGYRGPQSLHDRAATRAFWLKYLFD